MAAVAWEEVAAIVAWERVAAVAWEEVAAIVAWEEVAAIACGSCCLGGGGRYCLWQLLPGRGWQLL